jgi:hypothetical protein
MNIRLIKPGMSRSKVNYKRPPAVVPIIETVQSWVLEFQSSRAKRARRDFELVVNSKKT